MIASLKSGEAFTGFFVLRSKEIRIKKDKTAKYLAVELGDSTGRIFGSVWKNASTLDVELNVGTIVKVKGHVIEWHGKPHLSIEQIRSSTATDDVDVNDFIPKGPQDPEELFEKIKTIISSINDSKLELLLNGIFKSYQKEFKTAPGGKLWHHAYVGGLLEHSFTLANICDHFAGIYEHVNRDLLVSGALLHDIGKIYEYRNSPFIDYTDVGRLHGHIAMGFHLVACEINNIDDFPSGLKQELLHLILSHQGGAECGSPIQPLSREAFLLNYADEIDSKMNAFERIYAKEADAGKTWSNYVNLLDRFLYFGHSMENQTNSI